MVSAPFLAMREKGGTVKISIGTALAIEGALGIYPDRPQSPPPINRYDEVWFNLFTLLRNLLGSLTAQQQRAVLPGELVDALREDIAGAAHAVEFGTNGKVMPVFYLNDYAKLAQAYPHAELKVPATDLQVTLQQLELQTLRLLMRDPPVAVRSYGLRMEGNFPSSLIVTHLLVDLLSRYSFKRLDLLESHTGLIKIPSQWNTKLGVKEGAEHLPFNAFTLQIFGDRNVQFRPQSLTLRQTLLDIAAKDRWTPMSTMDRIKTSINNTKDPDLMTATKVFMS